MSGRLTINILIIAKTAVTTVVFYITIMAITGTCEYNFWVKKYFAFFGCSRLLRKILFTDSEFQAGINPFWAIILAAIFTGIHLQ
jgi:hypothetical protein